MKPYKAVVAGALALIGSLVTAAQTPGITTVEWLTAAGAAVVAAGAVYGVSNGG